MPGSAPHRPAPKGETQDPGKKHHASFYRFFRRVVWSTAALGRILFQMRLPWILGSVIWTVVDDALNRRNGPRVWGAAMHYDPLAATDGKGTRNPRHTAFAFGPHFVVLGVGGLSWNAERGVCVPVLARLYRPKTRCPALAYRKRTKLAAALLIGLARWLLEDRLYGQRLSIPEVLACDPHVPWETIKTAIYGRRLKMQVKTRIGLWPRVAGGSRPSVSLLPMICGVVLPGACSSRAIQKTLPPRSLRRSQSDGLWRSRVGPATAGQSWPPSH